MIFWIASYPKSGNTWLRALISSYYYSKDGVFNQDLLKKIDQFPTKKYFKGFDSDLTEIRTRVSIPIIRKDFIVDRYQLYESKLLGADCILIILSMLEKNNAKDLEEEAINIGLDVLIETHNSTEMDIASEMKSNLIGINNRDLNDFSVDINNSLSLTSEPLDGKIYVCESGIKTKENIDYIKNNSPIRTFLIGESLMRSNNLKEQIRTLLI